jgi:hypothetical protein
MLEIERLLSEILSRKRLMRIGILIMLLIPLRLLDIVLLPVNFIWQKALSIESKTEVVKEKGVRRKRHYVIDHNYLRTQGYILDIQSHDRVLIGQNCVLQVSPIFGTPFRVIFPELGRQFNPTSDYIIEFAFFPLQLLLGFMIYKAAAMEDTVFSRKVLTTVIFLILLITIYFTAHPNKKFLGHGGYYPFCLLFQ